MRVTTAAGSGRGCLQNRAAEMNARAKRNHHPKWPNFVDKLVHAAHQTVTQRIKTRHQHRIIHVSVPKVDVTQNLDKVFTLFEKQNL